MCGPEHCRNLDLICQISGSLPPANEVWGKVIFSEACVKNSVRGGGGAWSGGCLVPGVPGRGGGGACSRGRCLLLGGCLLETPPMAAAAGGTHSTGIHSC